MSRGGNLGDALGTASALDVFVSTVTGRDTIQDSLQTVAPASDSGVDDEVLTEMGFQLEAKHHLREDGYIPRS